MNNQLTVIDFEGSVHSGVVEFGCVVLEGGEIVETATEFCRAEQPISARERATHHIDTADVVTKAPFRSHWSFFAERRKHGLFVAHSANVEDALLRKAWPTGPITRHPIDASPTVTWGPWIDTLYLYKSCYPQLPSYALSDLISTFQLESALIECAQNVCPRHRQTFHCALFDALAAALLLQRLSGSLPELLYASSSNKKQRENFLQKKLL
ncbi:MAG: hypothetical protein A2Y14_05085 [Verrucomicrobia bacterium GWF2_51_19]|nr:MAG: hypothetical protein A2Y14_05085 [Verrucomicrobia bacterium GWF2_51_19]HCJ11735.1 hypothetical protein [Opitutae bacterium]